MAASTSIDSAKSVGTGQAENALASQRELLSESLRLNTAMAWYQMAIALAGKIAGR